MPYKMKRISSGLAILSSAIIALSSCGGNASKNEGAQQQPANYQVFTVTPQAATLHTSYPAVMQGEQTIDIRPKVDGYIEKIYVDEGSVVKKGQLLFKLSAPEY